MSRYRVLREDMDIQCEALDEALGNVPENNFDVMQEALKGFARFGGLKVASEALMESEEPEVEEELDGAPTKISEHIQALRDLCRK